MENTAHLTRVVAPTINDSNIVESLQDAIDVINKNFITLASVPFLQGVKGDNYHTVIKHIFENNYLTSDGALLLSCIFEKNISANQSFDNVKDFIKNNITGTTIYGSPLDSLRNEDKYINNDLYFYTLVNDAGDEYGEQLGQYYYFIDGRIKNIGDIYVNNKTDLIDFTDYSGFYRYIPKTDNTTAKYERINILPTLYYDVKNNDICWKYYDSETGISAVGPAGKDGKSSIITIVNAAKYGNNSYGKIMKVGTGGGDELWDETETAINSIQENTPLVICFVDKQITEYAFGIAKKISIDKTLTMCAVWDKTSLINDFLKSEKIKDYLDSINNTSVPSDPKYLHIPYGGTEKETNNLHTLAGDTKGGLVLRSKNNNGVKTSNNFILDKYSIVLTDYKDNIIDKSSYISINSDEIHCTHNGNTTVLSGEGLKFGQTQIGLMSNAFCAQFANNIKTYAGDSYKKNGSSISEINYVGMPIASIIMYFGYIDTSVAGKSVVEIGNCWLLCNGASLGNSGPRNKYSALIEKIGDYLPNFRGVFPCGVGINDNIGSTGGKPGIYLNLNTGNKDTYSKTYAGLWVGAEDQKLKEKYDEQGKKYDKYDVFSESANIANIKLNNKIVNSSSTKTTDQSSAGIGYLSTARTYIPTVPLHVKVHFLIKYI